MNVLDFLFGLEAKRQRLLKKIPESPLKDFLSVPFPLDDNEISNSPILAVDFETTGLNSLTDQILSMGFVKVDNYAIKLGTAEHHIINTQGELKGENVAIHQITDDEKAAGKALEHAVEALLEALKGRVMLVHFNRIEKNFLERACKQLYGYAPVFPMIDTLMIAKRRMDQSTAPYDPSKLRLTNLREHHGLPGYFAHNALNDAIATVELLFAEVSLMKRNEETPLKQLLL